MFDDPDADWKVSFTSCVDTDVDDTVEEVDRLTGCADVTDDEYVISDVDDVDVYCTTVDENVRDDCRTGSVDIDEVCTLTVTGGDAVGPGTQFGSNRFEEQQFCGQDEKQLLWKPTSQRSSDANEASTTPCNPGEA